MIAPVLKALDISESLKSDIQTWWPEEGGGGSGQGDGGGQGGSGEGSGSPEVSLSVGDYGMCEDGNVTGPMEQGADGTYVDPRTGEAYEENGEPAEGEDIATAVSPIVRVLSEEEANGHAPARPKEILFEFDNGGVPLGFDLATEFTEGGYGEQRNGYRAGPFHFLSGANYPWRGPTLDPDLVDGEQCWRPNGAWGPVESVECPDDIVKYWKPT